MELSKDDIRDIAFGAVLHDIGKLIIYERILNKPGTLDKEEWEVLKKHPEVGAAIIENMEFLSGAIAHVKHHHEKWDGSGYPDGLEGDDIPLGARIISVADSFDAMTTDRSYRKALTWKEAKAELHTYSGTQFDPEVADSFIALIEKDGFRPRSREKDEPVETTSDT
ncbi:MAG: HD domain-containing protein [bacterium]|nr:HD domain-containing protein [bacterium]